MPLLHIVILALVQGITEFLPISSSGHLLLTHQILGSQGAQTDLMMDIAVHVGTLATLLIYFRSDVWKLLRAAPGLIVPAKRAVAGSRMLINVICASLPVIAAGYLLHKTGPDWTRSVELMAWATFIFAIALWYADRKPQDRPLENLTLPQAMFIGLAQIISLVPGTSRSGITMTAGRFVGLSRTDCARFSLLLAMVAIAGAGCLEAIALVRGGDVTLTVNAALAAVFSFVSSYITLVVMMRWLKSASFMPFVIYRLALGVVLLTLLYSGAIT